MSATESDRNSRTPRSRSKVADSPSPRMSPGSHQNDPKQHNLDQKTAQVIRECGGLNYIQSQYQLELAKAILSTPVSSEEEETETLNPILRNLYPQISIVENNEAWEKALCLAVAYIKRYKMSSTLAAMKIEFDKVPKSTGYSRASEVDCSFQSILDFSKSLKEVSVKDRVDQFAQIVNEQFPEDPIEN